MIRLDNKKVSMSFKGRISELLRKLGLDKEEVVVMINGEVALNDEIISSEQEIEIITTRSKG